MKTAIVPAQITTIEDKIAGNLTLQQMILLASPVFIDFVLYAVLPTPFKLQVYKFALMAIVTIIFDLLSIRFRGKILLVWAATLLRYNNRPLYYVFNKNNPHLRSVTVQSVQDLEIQQEAQDTGREVKQSLSRLTQEDIFKLERIIANPSSNLSFVTSKKGGLYVSITEVE